jgi:hypothetical protein
MTALQLREILHAPDVETAWKQTIESFTNGAPQDRLDLAEWIMGIRSRVIAHADDVEDEEELRISVALGYIELKSHWQMLNTQINYQVFRKGAADQYLLHKSSLLSVLVDKLSSLINPEDLQKIQEFLLNPTAEAL